MSSTTHPAIIHSYDKLQLLHSGEDWAAAASPSKDPYGHYDMAGLVQHHWWQCGTRPQKRGTLPDVQCGDTVCFINIDSAW